MTDPMTTLRDEIVAAMDRYRAERAVIDGKITALDEILGTMDEIAEAEPVPPVVGGSAAERFGTGRAPRRDVMGAVRQAVRGYIEVKGVGPRLLDVTEGASILLGGTALTESAARRALDALIAKGEMLLHDNRYATRGYSASTPVPVADAAQ